MSLKRQLLENYSFKFLTFYDSFRCVFIIVYISVQSLILYQKKTLQRFNLEIITHLLFDIRCTSKPGYALSGSMTGFGQNCFLLARRTSPVGPWTPSLLQSDPGLPPFSSRTLDSLTSPVGPWTPSLLQSDPP